MWNRISGKSSETKDDVSSKSTRRNGDESRSTKRPSDSGSVVSSNSNKKCSSWGDDRDRGYNPTSTSYSSTSKSAYPGTAPASVASSYATAGKNDDDEPYVPPGLIRNASLADQMPKSKSSRTSREAEEDESRTQRRRKEDRDDDLESRDRGDRKREKREKRDKQDKDRVKDRGFSRSESGFGEGKETSLGPADFPDQVGSVGFSQFPDQYDGAVPGSTSAPQDHSSMSSHVQDQFPGQFPTQSTEPYRPPIAPSEGGPGLAAEYYGDAGQSVHDQPGFRKHSPSLIVGAEPHLLPASVEANPPPEPSASGGVGAAASFFSGSFEEDEPVTSHGQQHSSTYSTAPSRPENYNSSSAPAIPTIGGAAMGATAGYFMGSQPSSHQQRPDDAPSEAGAQSEYSSSTYQRPPSEAQNPYYSNASRPSKPGKPSPHSSNVPMYAAGAAGAAGLAAAAYQQSHHSSPQHNASMSQHSHPSQHPTTPMMQRHRHRGPFGALVDFFKDPDGVAQFEEYSEITGICKYCFEPGSSPRDAPRRHRYRKRRSNERLGSSTRIDKDSRYYSSENENRRNKDRSWLATGLAGYGLGKVGETLFKQQNDFDDTYSVKTGRHSPDGRGQKSRHRRRSKEGVETGITGDGKIYKKDPHGFGGPTTTTYSTRRRSRSRSRSRDRKSTLTEAALGTAIGASVAGSSFQRRSHSPKRAFVRTSHKSRSPSPERQRKSHKKKKEKGFFGFGRSPSSSSVDLAYNDKHGSSKRSKAKSKDDQKAEAALLGLGAAAAALALNDSRQGHKKKGVKELVGVKETRDRHDHGSRSNYKQPRVSSRSSEDEAWESAAEDDGESVDIGLAYGVPARRRSRESLSSESSGTNKWRWRWGSKKERRGSPPKRKSSDHSGIPAVAGAVGAGLIGAAVMSPDQYSGLGRDSTTSVPLQHVFPVPTSDPGRFDVGREGSVASSSRPGVVPIQHPQPITPVSAALYSSQAPHEHSYSAPAIPPVFSRSLFQSRPTDIDSSYNVPQYGIPGGFPQDNHQTRDVREDFKIRRRDTSPARFGIDAIASSMTPRRQSSAKDDTSNVKIGTESVTSAAESRRRLSTKDDSSAVRFAQTEVQEEEERRERRRKRKEEKQRREAEEEEQIDRDRRAPSDKSTRNSDAKVKREKSPERSSEKSWAAPAAIGIAGPAISVAAAIERSKSEETRDERRERRRREREEEAAEDEEKSRRRERRRRERERERETEESTSKESRKMPDFIPEALQDVDGQVPRAEEEQSVWQEAASAKSSHINYGDFFTPPELRNKSTDQVKVTSANSDADIDLDRSPNIVAIEPRGFRDPNALPEFSKADTNEQIDLSKLDFPWRVPRLRLLEPTPPSTRGSTPVIRPKIASDDDVEELPSRNAPSRVSWGDDETHEYTVITPRDERERFVQSPDESSNRDRAEVPRATDERETSPDRKQQERPPNGTTQSSGPPAYGDDLEFAATLAASAEDAGFDPSLVIDDPIYRRRDSPPGSNDRSMPGGFDDKDEPRLSKKERKRKDKAARRQSEEETNGRDDDAIVQDIISQVGEFEPRDAQSDPINEVDDEWETGKKSKSKRPKKDRKDSGSRDEFYETSESISRPEDPESRQVYDSPTEDVQYVVSSTTASKDGERSKKHRKKSKHDSIDFEDAASTISSRSTTVDNNDKPKEKRGKSIWSRVLGKSTDSLPQENGTKDGTTEAAANDFEERKKKSKKFKERRSTRDDFDDDDARSRSSTTSNKESKRRSNGGSTGQDSGRIAQDLPTKVYPPAPSGRDSPDESLTAYKGHLNEDELEKVDEQRSESFLGERPEPPPPPDMAAREEEPPDYATAVGIPATPRSLPDDHTRQYAEPQASDPLQSPPALASPTAVPFHFRRPRPSPGSGRSQSQTPFSSGQITADLPLRQKPRPRSTEFKSSTEFRPLWLVEKHRSQREPAPEETYPSLPSSHTNSRSSSVHDPDEDLHDQRGDYEMTEVSHEPIEGMRELSVDTHDSAMPSDLLDSQQATPTASTFQHSAMAQDLPSLPASRASSPTFVAEDDVPKSSSTLRDAALGAEIGGTVTYTLHKMTPHDETSREGLSREEDQQFHQGLDDLAPNSGAHRSYEKEDLAGVEHFREGNQQSQEVLDDMTTGADADQSREFNDAYDDDFAPQNGKKAKKGKRKARKRGQTEEQSSSAALKAAPTTSTEPEPLSPEELRRIQEQDAQDAVDSWFEPSTSSKKDKKKKKKNGVFEELSDECDATSALMEPPRDKTENTEPKEAQENDNLTQDMPRAQVVDTVISAAQGENNDEAEVSEAATKRDEAPIENLLLRRQSKSKGKRGKKARKNTWDDDIPPTPPAASAAKEAHFVDPFSDRMGEDLSRSRQAETATNEGVESTESQPTATTPRLELSPMAIPLPIDDDLDLFEEQPISPIAEAGDREPSHEQERLPQGLSEVVPVETEIATLRQPLDESRDPPTQPEQVEADDFFDLPTKKKGKKGKKTKPSDTTELATVAETDTEAPLPTPIIAVDDEEQVRDIVEEPIVDAPLEETNVAEDEWAGLSTKKKGKKAKQSFTDDTTAGAEDETELPLPITTPQTNKDEQVQKLVQEAVVNIPHESRDVEDEWAGFSTKKKGKKGQKQDAKPFDLGAEPIDPEPAEPYFDAHEANLVRVPTATTTTSQEVTNVLRQDETEPPLDQKLDEASDINVEAHRDLQEPVFAQPIDRHDGGFLPEAKAESIAEPSETRCCEDITRKPDIEATDPIVAPSAATTDTAKDIQDMLRNEDSNPSMPRNRDKIAAAPSTIEGTSADKSVEEEEPAWTAPIMKKKGNKGKKSEVFLFDEPENPDLAETSTPPVKFPRSVEEEPAFPAIERPPAETPVQDEEPDWAAPKKTKKGKKSKKKEVFAFDEPETTEPTETSTPPVQIEQSAERDPTVPPIEQAPADQPPEEEQPEWTAPKKTKKGKKGRKSEVFSIEEPEDKELSGSSTRLVEAEPSVERELRTVNASQEESAITPSTIEEVFTETPIEEIELEWATQMKKKGKKGKKSQVFSFDDLESSESPATATPPFEADPSTVEDPETEFPRHQEDSVIATAITEETAAEHPVGEAESDWDAPKKKKGKKGKKNQVFAYDDLDNSEYPATATPTVGIEPPIVQEPAVVIPSNQDYSAIPTATTEAEGLATEIPVEETEPDWIAPTKKKGKKGKKNQVFAYDDLDDSESQATATTPVEAEPSAVQEPAIEEVGDFSYKKSKKDKKGKKGKKNEVFAFDESENLESIEISTLPSEVEPSVEREPATDETDDFFNKKSKKDKKRKKKVLSRTASGVEDVGEDKDNELPEVSFPEAAAATEANQSIEPVAIELTDPIEEEVICDKTRELEPLQEDDFAPLRSEKHKKIKKKGLSRNPSSFEDAIENRDDELPDTLPSNAAATRPEQVDEPVEPAESIEAEVISDQARELGPLQEEEPMPPKSKKNKKKAKKSKAFDWNDEGAPTLESEPALEPRIFGEAALDQSMPLGDVVVEQPEEVFEERPKSKEDRKKSKKSQPSSLDDDMVAQVEQEAVREADASLKDAGHEEPNTITPYLPEEHIMPGYEGRAPNHEYIGSESAELMSAGPPKDISSTPVLSKQEPIALDDPNAPTIVVLPQDAEDWSRQDQLTEVTEPAEVVEPGDELLEPQRDGESMPAFKPSEETVGLDPLLLVDRDDDLEPVRKSKKGKWSKKDKLPTFEPEEDQSNTDTKDFYPVQDGGLMLETSERADLDAPESMQTFEDASKSINPSSAQSEKIPFAMEVEGTNTTKTEADFWDMPVKKGKKDKKQHKEAHKFPDEPDVVDVSFVASPEATRDFVEAEPEPHFDAGIEAPSTSAKGLPTPVAEVEMLDEEEQREYDRRYSQELDRQILDAPRRSETNLLASVAEDEPHEQPEYREHYAEAETQKTGTFATPATYLATPAMDVELLDAQEQREYDDEYAKELERQLSPLQNEEYANMPPQSDELQDSSNRQASIDGMIKQPVPEQPITERPFEDIHRPLAQAPGLEDIIEESRSRSGSAQDLSVDREDDCPPFKSTKKGKKSKKGKTQPQPIIWEDETATLPVDEESKRVVEAPPETPLESGSWEMGTSNRPIDLEEPIERHPIDLTSSAVREPSKAQDDADDYFGIRPSKVAEEDVGLQQTDNFERLLPTEQPRAQSPRWEQHPGQVEQMYHDQPREEATYERVESSQAKLPETSRSGSMPNEGKVDDEFNYAPTKKSKKEKRTKRREYEEEPSYSTLPSEEYAQQSSYPQFSTNDVEREMSASRERSLQRPPRDDDELTSKTEERAKSGSRSRNTEGLAAAAATGLGIGTLAAESISRKDSKKEGKKGKKSKKSSKQVGFEEEPREEGSPLNRKEFMPDYPEQDRKRERHNTPPHSPRTHADRESIMNEPDLRGARQPPDSATYRDSAIHVSDSPTVLEDASSYRLIRDSGYPDTETSPTMDVARQYEDMDTQRDSRDFHNGELEEGIIDEYDRGPRTSEHRRSISEYDTERDPEDTHDGEIEQDIIDGYDQDSRIKEHSRSDPEDALNEFVEADPEYDVSVLRPSERRRRSKQRSGAAYDSDDSADSGFDIRRRRRLQVKADEPRKPSPVSSTTKDRSSALFVSSPSAREERPDQPTEEQSPSRNVGVHEAPTWSFGREESLQGRSRDVSETSRSPFATGETTDPSTYEKLTGGREPPPSLFGGPVGHDDEMMSRSMSPPSSDIRGRHRLNTISEDSQERLSLHKKDKRADSDIGSPKAGVKERRMRSPPGSGYASGRYISTDDLISSQPWPTVDEDKHSVDFERSRSPGTDQPSSRQITTPNLPMFPAKQRESDRKTSNSSSQSDNSIHAIIRTPDQVRSASGQSFRSSGTPPLRRVDRSASGDLRGASKLSEAKSRAKNSEAEPDINIPSSSTYDPVTDKGKNRADMADVYVSCCNAQPDDTHVFDTNRISQEAYGNARGQSPMSPTRPPSMRKRQSMQMLDLETRLDQLVSENRLLQSQRSTAERAVQDQARDHSQQRHAYEEAMQEHKVFLSQKESELNELKQILEEWQSKVIHLTEVNEEITSSRGLDKDHHQRYRELEIEHADLREQHTQLSTGMESIVQHEVAVALEEKNLELYRLGNELDNAKQQVRNLQQQLLASRASDDFVERDDDYFDGQCQALCQHVQQWVLRFSKFSDMKACYRASEARDEKVVDRMENALLDGTDLDEYLQDRVKRRDVFMSVVMTMIWELIFTRYLFGMDREQRQKLKNLEKTLQEVGPMPAVHKWRATTLTLLMKRQSFENQSETDTEAVVHEIYDTLATFLPPPSHLVNQIQDSLRKVINEAVDLSIEMRTQRADYQMLPPLVPEYDTNGDLVGKVRFNALTMNERSGTTSSNEALEEQEAVVRMVLFPLVVRTEEDDEQIVVCPAQVLTAQGSKGKKSVRVLSVQGSTQGGRSEASFVGSDVHMEGGMI